MICFRAVLGLGERPSLVILLVIFVKAYMAMKLNLAHSLDLTSWIF